MIRRLRTEGGFVLKQIIASAVARAGDMPVQWHSMKKWEPRSHEGPGIMWRGGKALVSDTAEIRQRGNYHVGDDCLLSVGDRTTLTGCTVSIQGHGSAVIIGPDCRLQNVSFVVQNPNSLVIIAKRTTWESGAAICTDGRLIAIDEDCMFSNQVILRTSDGHGIFDEDGALINEATDVHVGAHVWLGNGARVNKGTRIARCVIVGQGAIASGHLDREHHVYAGIPARPVKGPVNWGRQGNWQSVPERFRYQRPKIEIEPEQPQSLVRRLIRFVAKRRHCRNTST